MHIGQHSHCKSKYYDSRSHLFTKKEWLKGNRTNLVILIKIVREATLNL